MHGVIPTHAHGGGLLAERWFRSELARKSEEIEGRLTTAEARLAAELGRWRTEADARDAADAKVPYPNSIPIPDPSSSPDPSPSPSPDPNPNSNSNPKVDGLIRDVADADKRTDAQAEIVKSLEAKNKGL